MNQKYLKNPLRLVPLVMFIMVVTLPVAALKFENRANEPLVAHVELASRDPYLAQAIENLPDYEYTSAGALVTVPAPLTEKGHWPTPTAHFLNKVAAAADIRPKPVYAAEKGAGLVLEGEASFYSRAGCLGCDANVIMANGQPLNDNALTMAIGADKKHLVGHTARVTSLATGKSVMVRITDTGGFYKAKYGYRVADLTLATKQAIGMNGGVGQVRVEVF